MTETASADVIRFDFESGGIDGWKIVEGRLDISVTNRTTFNNGKGEYNKQGNWFFSTLESSTGKAYDNFTGVAESPVFILESPDMSMLVGGGAGKTTYIALCSLDGREKAFARGENSEKMHRVDWHIPEMTGQPVFLRIVDESTGSWGHITFDDFSATGTIDTVKTRLRFSDPNTPKMQRKLCKRLDEFDTVSLKKAIQEILASFPMEYPGNEFLNRLSEFENERKTLSAALISFDTGELKKAETIIDRFISFKRQALVANPLLNRQPVLFVVRNQYKPDHHNTETIFQAGEVNTESFKGGSALKVIDFSGGSGVRTLLEQTDGIIRDPEIYFDGGRIVFSMRNSINDDYHIYEINADGSGLRQLTFAAGVSDIDPMYLPDDSIVFSSTREPKFCMCNKHIMCNLFRMARMARISIRSARAHFSRGIRL